MNGLDLKGQRFGKLTAIEPTEERKGGYVTWKCQCDCGNIVYVTTTILKRGKRKSCGCMRKGRSTVLPLLGQRYGQLTVLEKSDKRKNGAILWKCQCDCGNIIYVCTSHLKNGTSRSCLTCASKKNVHSRLIDGTIADKIYSSINKNNTSGVKGVSFSKQSQKWVAQIAFQGKRYSLGSYYTKAEAVNARKAAEDKLYSEYLKKLKAIDLEKWEKITKKLNRQ